MTCPAAFRSEGLCAAEGDDDAATDEDCCVGIGGNGLTPLTSTSTIESSVSLRMKSLGVAPELDC